MNILDQIFDSANKLLQQNEKPVLVFDLDSTLFCVSPRTQFILRQFHLSDRSLPFRDSHEEAIEQLKSIETFKTDWGIKSAMIRDQIRGQIDFFEAVRAHWADGFFSNDLLEHDIMYPGALEFIQKIHGLGAEIRYLTGRDVPRMGPGSIQQLKRHGLPLEDESFLQMKPNTQQLDTDYKADYFDRFADKVSNVWFFENEPWILNVVKDRYPKLNIVYAETVHSGRDEPKSEWPRVGFDWTKLD